MSLAERLTKLKTSVAEASARIEGQHSVTDEMKTALSGIEARLSALAASFAKGDHAKCETDASELESALSAWVSDVDKHFKKPERNQSVSM